MSDGQDKTPQNECTALAPVVHEGEVCFERKKQELFASLKRGEVHDPFTAAVAAIFTVKGLVAAGVSVGVSLGTSLLTRALTPRQKFTTGDRAGQEVQITRVGIQPLPEIYGADPDGQGGGIAVGGIFAWVSGLRRHENTQRGTSGGGKGKPKTPEQTTIEYDGDFLILWANNGPHYLKRLKANNDVIYRGDKAGFGFIYEAEGGDNTLSGGAAIVTDLAASGERAVSVPPGGTIRFNLLYGDGGQIEVEFPYKTTGTQAAFITHPAGAGVTSFPDSSGAYRLYRTAPFTSFDSHSNFIQFRNDGTAAIVFDYARVRSASASGRPRTGLFGTGLFAVSADASYNQETPPDPNGNYANTQARYDGSPERDGEGVIAGTVSGGAGITNYPGTQTAPDPTYESATDAKYGAGSTPALVNRSLTVLSGLYLTKWQGAIPTFSGLLEHQTVKTLAALADFWCASDPLLEATDYDFTGVASKKLRGLLVVPKYQPADILEELAEIFNSVFYEADKIYCEALGGAVIDTVQDSEIGWLDEGVESEEILPELDSDYERPELIPRRVEIRSFDPRHDYEHNLQGDAWQVWEGEHEETADVALTLTAEEAKEAAQRIKVRRRVESTVHHFTADWSKLWWTAGKSITVIQAEGFTRRIRLTSVKPCIGIIECEGVAEDVAAFTQPVSTSSGGVFEVPPVPIPQMTIVQFFDTPLLRDAEAYVNGGSGFYAGVVKRTGEGAWNGAALYVDKGLGYELLETFEAQATIGRTVTVLTGTTKTTEAVADTVTVDLYGDEATLESTTKENLMRGAGACLIGSEVCQILTATLDGSNPTLYPNRWNLTIGLRGIRGTESKVKTHVVNERFVLINDALKFVPVNVNEVNTSRNYKAVTSGQSQADAAVVPFAWLGGTLKPLAPSVRYTTKNNALDLYMEFDRQARIASTLRDYAEAPLAEEVEEYVVEIYDSAT